MEPAQGEKRHVISAGNPELDSRMGDGIPVGSLTLIEGDSGTGKSVLTQQIMKGSLHEGFTITLFTSENSVKSLVSQMQSIDLDILDYLLLGKLRVYPMRLAKQGGQALSALLDAVKHETDHDIVVIDSCTAAINHTPDARRVLGFFEQCKGMCATGTSILVTLHAQAIDGELLSPLRSMCDANLVLRSEQDGQRLVKTLQVSKIRGAASITGAIVGFEVEPGWGMRVIPISKARG